MKRFFFLLYFLGLTEASLTNRLGELFSGKQAIKDAVLSGDNDAVTRVLKLRSCDLLLQNEHELLKIVVENDPNKMLHRIFNDFCIFQENFLIKAVQSALRYEDEQVLDNLLNVLRERLEEFHNYLVGGVFERCAMAKHIRCIETMVDWQISLTTNGKNIVHLAAQTDNMRLINLAPRNESFLDKRANNGYFPMNLVSSKEMAQAILNLWDQESKKILPSMESVMQIHYMAKLFKLNDNTLNLRVHYAASELQERINKEEHFTLTVHRKTIFKNSYEQAHRQFNSTYWYRPELNVRIIFVGEAGIDAGGPRLDWLGEIIRVMFISNREGKVEDFTAPIFVVVDEDTGMYAPNMEYISKTSNTENVFKFAGSIVALAFRDKLSLNVKFIPAITKALAKSNWKRYDEVDFAEQHPQIHKSLMNLNRLTDEELKDFDETLTGKNLSKYISDVGADYLYKKYERAIQAFANGFHIINDQKRLFNVFTHRELADVLRGGEQVFDLESFKNHCVISGTNGSKEMFWEMMEMLNEEEKMKFFKFVTGRSSLPFEGIYGLTQKIKIKLDELNEGLWPTAATCFSIASFPKNLTAAQEMKEKLFKSIEKSGSEFGKE